MVEDKVQCFIQKNNLMEKGETIGVAVSGGKDSMALLFLLQKIGYQVKALHFEHGIRGEDSLKDAGFVQQYCKKNNIELIFKSEDVPAFAAEHKMGIEAAGRMLRYRFFRSLDLKVATAHHLNDNVESVLMNMARGCAYTGLKGIAKKNDNIVRPFLSISRQDIEQYVEENNIPYVEDKTNYDTRYMRNFVRHTVINDLKNVNSNVIDNIGRLIENIDELDQTVTDLKEKIPFEFDGECVKIKKEDLLQFGKAIAYHKLLDLCQIVKSKTDIEKIHLKQVIELNETGKYIHIKHGIYAKYRYGEIIITAQEENKNEFYCVPLENETVIPGGKIVVCDDDALREDKVKESFGFLPKEAVVRTRQSGDLFCPLGSKTKKLKDFLIDQKIPRDVRDTIPLVAAGNEIIWVVGYRISENYKVLNKENKITLEYIRG